MTELSTLVFRKKSFIALGGKYFKFKVHLIIEFRVRVFTLWSGRIAGSLQFNQNSVQYSSPQDLLLYYGQLFTVFKGASMGEIFRKGWKCRNCTPPQSGSSGYLTSRTYVRTSPKTNALKSNIWGWPRHHDAKYPDKSLTLKNWYLRSGP